MPTTSSPNPILGALKAARLWSVTKIWLLSPYLPDEDRIGQPPWEPHGFHDLLGPANRSPENTTEPIHPQTMSGLLVWALRFVSDFSDDILRAAEMRTDMTARVSPRHIRAEDNDRLDRYLNDLRRDGNELPGFTDHTGRLLVGRQYLAARLDVPVPTPIQGWFERHLDTGRSAHGHPHQRPNRR